MKNLITTVFAFSVLTGIATQVQAHGVWAGMRADNLQIVYGEGPLDNFYKPSFLQKVNAYNAKLEADKVTVTNKNDTLLLKPSATTQVISIVSDNGYWSKGSDGKMRNIPKNEHKGATMGNHYPKMSVNYISQDILFKKDKPLKIKKPHALGLTLELVPQVDPRFLKAGDKLRITVLYKGKPVAKADVMPDSINHLGETVQTNAKGEAVITVANNGVNSIAVEKVFPLTGKDKTPKADNDKIFSSLVFTIMP